MRSREREEDGEVNSDGLREGDKYKRGRFNANDERVKEYDRVKIKQENDCER